MEISLCGGLTGDLPRVAAPAHVTTCLASTVHGEKLFCVFSLPFWERDSGECATGKRRLHTVLPVYYALRHLPA